MNKAIKIYRTTVVNFSTHETEPLFEEEAKQLVSVLRKYCQDIELSKTGTVKFRFNGAKDYGDVIYKETLLKHEIKEYELLFIDSKQLITI